MGKDEVGGASTRDRVLGASGVLFRRRGFSGTGMKAIAAASSAPFGSVYHFFPGGKVELGRAVIEDGARRFAALVDAQLAPHDDAASAIEAFFDAAAKAVETSGYEDACPVATIAMEVAGTNEELRLASAAAFDRWMELAAAHLVRMGLEHEQASRLAALALAALEGAFILARVRRDAEIIRLAGHLVANACANPSA